MSDFISVAIIFFTVMGLIKFFECLSILGRIYWRKIIEKEKLGQVYWVSWTDDGKVFMGGTLNALEQKLKEESVDHCITYKFRVVKRL